MSKKRSWYYGVRKKIAVITYMVLLSSLFFTNITFGATPETLAPTQNAQGAFEISTPEQLLYVSNNIGSEDMKLSDHYVLTADIDMAGITDFIPIGRSKKINFTGIFDGQGHVIKNLVLNFPDDKYIGFIGCLGNDYGPGTVKNLGMVNIDFLGQKNVAGIAGGNYGIIENCFVSGKIYGTDGSDNNCMGGIVGKHYTGESGNIGVIKNCYAVVDVEGTYNVGGLQGKANGGGMMENCYAAGTVKARHPIGAAGGLIGSFNASEGVESCASLVSSITGPTDIDKLAGQLYDESGQQVTNCIAWDATSINGNEPIDQPIKWVDKSSTELSSKSTYIELGWDFDHVWAWKGIENNGYPILKSFDEKDQEYVFDWSVDTVINAKPVNKAKANNDIEIPARIISSQDISAVEIYYGDNLDGTTFTNKVNMVKQNNDIYIGKIPALENGNIYYYIKATNKDNVITKPFDITNSINIYIDDGTILGNPHDIAISLGEKQSILSFSWLTVPEVEETVLEYAKKESFNGKYTQVEGTNSIAVITPGFNEKRAHKITLENLDPDTSYIYKVGNGKEFMSPEYEFTTPPALEDTDEFNFFFMADPQSVSIKDYEAMKLAYDYALTEIDNPAFTLIAGDIVQTGYKTSEWANLFVVNQDTLATIPIMPSVGNHDVKGDPTYVNFKARFNLPQNAPSDDLNGTVYSWEYGDALFFTLNTECLPSSTLEEKLNIQLDWMEERIKKSNKKWNIVQLHAGPYTSDHDGEYIRNIVCNRFDELKIDLVLSGHDHIYIRSTMKGDEKVALGEGTTYVTGGTVGNKFYRFNNIADPWTEVFADEEKRQIVSLVTVSKDKIIFKAMQRVAPDSEEFEEVDFFELTNSLAANKKE